MTRTVVAPLDTAAASHPRLGALLSAKVRLLAPLTILYVTAYVGLTALAGFGKPVMAAKVAGHKRDLCHGYSFAEWALSMG